MKKIFALVLAVAMLSTTAFAADYVVAGTSGTGKLDATGISGTVNPNSTIGIPRTYFAKGASLLKIDNGEFNNANFAISARKFKKGANLVKSVTIDDTDEMVIITLNQDLALRAPKNAANLVIDDISVKSKKAIAKGATGTDPVARSAVYNYSTSKLMNLYVGYTEKTMNLNESPVVYGADTITNFVAKGGVDYAIASYEKGDLYVEGRVYGGDKIYVSIGSGIEKEVLKAYPDADLRFAKLTTSGFTSNNTINILADEDEFVYEIVDKKVVKTNLKWDADNYTWTGKTMTDKYYVISDMELKAIDAPAAPGATNPETGANDVVGIAAALAVISLVAAGAVSLKK